MLRGSAFFTGHLLYHRAPRKMSGMPKPADRNLGAFIVYSSTIIDAEPP